MDYVQPELPYVAPVAAANQFVHEHPGWGVLGAMSEAADSAAALPQTQNRTLGDTVRAYYALTKPGIIYSNAMTAVSGYIFASLWHVRPLVLLSLVAGTMLLIASACVLNNYIDRPLDRHMKRTQKRA